MLDTNTMRAIGRLIARQARKQAPEAAANDVIELIWGRCLSRGKQERRNRP